ncbi:hypothetical protein ABG768_007373 [Culter alburnus]|uniref:Perilipin n=1 Tax=Culter alburnus TaxID=194366 RepID=A0AAW1ZNQ0_CULAL
MASVDVVNNQNVVDRIVHLPLVISTYGMVSNVYCNTKNNHPYLKSVCEVAENGVKSITSAAFYSALPIIGKLEPQISIANDLACKGLDKIEKTLPILHKPSDQIVANAKEAVQDSMEKTKTVVSGGVQTMMESRAVKLMSSRVDTALSTSETLLEQYLPEAEEVKECEVKNTEGFENNSEASSYFVRLGSLSSKVKDRAYQRAVEKIEYTRSLMGWKTGTESQEENETVTDNEAEETESRTVTVAYNLSQQLQTTYLVLVSSLKDLPQHVSVQVTSVSQSAIEIYSSFRKTAAIGDMPSTILVISRSQLSRIGESMDNVMDYLVNNTPLNWLVGPFYPRVQRSTANGPKSNKQTTLQPEVEMQSVNEDR